MPQPLCRVPRPGHSRSASCGSLPPRIARLISRISGWRTSREDPTGTSRSSPTSREGRQETRDRLHESLRAHGIDLDELIE